MKQAIVWALLGMAIGGAVQAQNGGSQPRKMPDPNKRVCKPVRPTGSRLAETVCHTNAEWQAIAQDQTGKAGQLMNGGDSGAH